MTNIYRLFPFQRFTVHEDSMLPTLKPGDDVLVFKFYKGLPGDVVVAQVSNEYLVKRLAKIEGSGYRLIGDNLKLSTDSRHFGPVDKRAIIGKVIFIARH